MLAAQSIFNSLAKLPFWPVLLVLLFLIYLLNVFFIIYHLTRFGIGAKPKLFALIFFAGAILLFAIAAYYFSQVQWGGLMPNWGQWNNQLGTNPLSKYLNIK